LDILSLRRITVIKLEEEETTEGGRKRGGRKEELCQKQGNTTAVPGCINSPRGSYVFQLISVKKH